MLPLVLIIKIQIDHTLRTLAVVFRLLFKLKLLKGLALSLIEPPMLATISLTTLTLIVEVLSVVVVLSLRRKYQPRKIFALPPPPTGMLILVMKSLLTLTQILLPLPLTYQIKLVVMVVLYLTHKSIEAVSVSLP